MKVERNRRKGEGVETAISHIDYFSSALRTILLPTCILPAHLMGPMLQRKFSKEVHVHVTV